jgi:DNA-binding LacI/PurR family transcriptional regulator
MALMAKSNPPDPPPRVTLKHIAARAGVARSTVSKALANSTEISATRRESIRALARKMGYRPDPALAALSSYRNNTRSSIRYQKIAYITAREKLLEKERDSIYWHQYETARLCAENHGYEMELFYLGTTKNESNRLMRILKARGIRSLLLELYPFEPKDFAFNWNEFFVVYLLDQCDTPPLACCMPDQYELIQRMVKEIGRRGYRRVLALQWYSELLVLEGKRRTVVMRESFTHEFLRRSRFEKTEFIALNELLKDELPRLRTMIAKDRYDCLFIIQEVNADDRRAVIESGIPIPEKVGLVSLLDPWKSIDCQTGIIYCRDRVIEAGVQLLHERMSQNRLGLDAFASTLMVKNIWNEGTDLPWRCPPPDA